MEIWTREQLLGVPVPLETRTYKPIPHKILFDEVYEKLDKAGLSVLEEDYRVDNSGKKLIAKLKINQGDSEKSFMIAFRNSYDKSMSVAYAAGVQVIICGNGMVSGEFNMKHKHNGDIVTELDSIINLTINSLEEVYNDFSADILTLKSIELTRRQIAEHAGRLLMLDNVITSTQLGIIHKEFNNSTYPDFEDLTAWSFYNWTTHALKESHSLHMIQNHIGLHEYFKHNIM